MLGLSLHPYIFPAQPEGLLLQLPVKAVSQILLLMLNYTTRIVEVRGHEIKDHFTISPSQNYIDVPQGNSVAYEIGYNIRANGYLSYPAPTKIMPIGNQSFTIYISSAAPFAAYGYTTPLTNYSLTSNFGWRSYGSNGDYRYNVFNNHTGVDMSVVAGTQISSISNVAAADFTSGFDASEGYYVHVEPASSYRIRYMHMLEQFGTSGVTSVNQGEYIGRVGSTGNSTGPHLHIDISYDGAFYDPLAFFG